MFILLECHHKDDHLVAIISALSSGDKSLEERIQGRRRKRYTYYHFYTGSFAN